MISSRLQSYREKPSRLVAGVMSGTSIDGIDVAFVDISGSGSDTRFQLLGFEEVPIDGALRTRLLTACSGEITLRAAFELDVDLGDIYADAILEAAAALGIDTVRIDAIGLHGQTVYHAPRREPRGVTVQLGSGAVVAERLRTIVVNDFRTADVAAGGEGAPLVPYCDYLLLGSAVKSRIALNIGGIANITWLPADGSAETTIAFDTGPGNMLVDAAMRELYGRNFDRAGEIASTGTPQPLWLEQLLQDEYYRWSPPKSAGRERFGEEEGRRMAREGSDAGYSDADIIASLTMLTVKTIALGIDQCAGTNGAVDEVIVGGGGWRNTTLIEMLRGELPESTILPSDEFGIPSDAKEALCFALLANETLNEERASLPSVTGAARPVICGAIRLP